MRRTVKNQKVNIIVLVALFIFTSTAPAFAYLDPGTGSMVLQILAGGVAGAIVIIRLYWKRFLVLIGARKELPVSEYASEESSPEQKL